MLFYDAVESVCCSKELHCGEMQLPMLRLVLVCMLHALLMLMRHVLPSRGATLGVCCQEVPAMFMRSQSLVTTSLTVKEYTLPAVACMVHSVEAEKQVAMRTSELRAFSPSFIAASPRASLRISTAAAGAEEAGLGSPYAAAQAAAGSGGGAGSLPSSPLASGGGAGGGSSSFAFTRSTCYRATSDGMEGFNSPSQANAYMQVRFKGNVYDVAASCVASTSPAL
jgi:hypothetical protein